MILQLGELGIIDVGVPQQARDEAERNLRAKRPAALPAFRTLADSCTRPLAMAPKSAASRLARAGEADPKDAPILASAIAADCRWLVTFNVCDDRTNRLRVIAPGPFIEALRELLATG